MNNLTPEQQKDCQTRIDQANKEIAEICLKYQVEPVVSSVKMSMGDTKFKGVETPLPLNDLVNHEDSKKVA